MLVIALTGKGGSGKGTVARYLIEKYDGRQYRFSYVLDDILKRIHKLNSRDNQINLALALRKLYGKDILAQIVKQDIDNEQPSLAVIDGLRYPEELSQLQKLPSFKLAAIKADNNIRYQRSIKRGEKAGEKTLTRTEFDALDKRDTEIHISALMKQADIVIDNNADLEHLYKQVDTLIKQWKLA